MRAASAGLISLLLSRQPTWSADLLTFSLVNGTTLRLASTDRDITYGGDIWIAGNAGSVGITRGQWSIKNTLDVPSMDITIISSGTDYAGGANIKTAIHNGLLDGAWIELDRAYMQVINGVYGDTTLGLVAVFAGRTGQVQITSTGAKITVRGANVLMNQYMPKNRFLTSCIHTLYDGGCTLSRAANTFSGTVLTASRTGVAWGADPTSGNYSQLGLGTITMTSGAALGEARTISGGAAGGVAIVYPWYVVPSPGDTFTVVYGCDKTRDGGNGCAFFANQQHFRGFRFTPPAETALVA